MVRLNQNDPKCLKREIFQRHFAENGAGGVGQADRINVKTEKVQVFSSSLLASRLFRVTS